MPNCKPMPNAEICTAPNPKRGSWVSFEVCEQSEIGIIASDVIDWGLEGAEGIKGFIARITIPDEISPELMQLLNSKDITVDL